MDLPKYVGTVHPEEFINEMEVYCNIRQITNEQEIVKYCKMMIDPTIEVSLDAKSCEDLIKELKKHITFLIFKNSCRRKLHLLKYQLERHGGDTPKFIANFRSLCHGAEVDGIEDQKNFLYYTLPNDFFRDEFVKQYEHIKSMNDLVVGFEHILNEYAKFILNGSVVALKHVATDKYLCSNVKHYTTGSKNQMVYCGKPFRDSNSSWTIKSFNTPELLSYGSTIFLQHNNTTAHLEIRTNHHNNPPVSNYTEVSCGSNNNYSDYSWILDRSKNGSQERYMKSHDVIVLKNTYTDYLTNQAKEEVLRSHDVTFTIEDDSYQEVFAHSEAINGKDEWIIEIVE